MPSSFRGQRLAADARGLVLVSMPMTTVRLIIWPVLLMSYAALFAAAIHTLLGNWSGVASLGMFFVIFIGVPSLTGYAAYLWRKKLLHGWGRTEAALCAAIPVVVVLLFALVASLDNSQASRDASGESRRDGPIGSSEPAREPMEGEECGLIQRPSRLSRAADRDQRPGSHGSSTSSENST